jgi:hypothetical protein
VPIEVAEEVVGMMRVCDTTPWTLGQRLWCDQVESAIHESVVDVMDESRAMNGLLLLLPLLRSLFPLRLRTQPMFCRLLLPLQRLSQP